MAWGARGTKATSGADAAMPAPAPTDGAGEDQSGGEVFLIDAPLDQAPSAAAGGAAAALGGEGDEVGSCACGPDAPASNAEPGPTLRCQAWHGLLCSTLGRTCSSGGPGTQSCICSHSSRRLAAPAILGGCHAGSRLNVPSPRPCVCFNPKPQRVRMQQPPCAAITHRKQNRCLVPSTWQGPVQLPPRWVRYSVTGVNILTACAAM